MNNKKLIINPREEIEKRFCEELRKEFDKKLSDALTTIIHPTDTPKIEDVPKRKVIELVVTRTVTNKITRCYHECPYFTLDGGTGPVMVCGHPSFKDYEGFSVISHPDCDDGFPETCPLLKENKINENSI